MIRLGSRGWELHPGPACAACTPYPGLRDAFWGRLWLRQFKNDPATLFQIRYLVLEADSRRTFHKATNDQAIEWLAGQLAAGEWHVHAPVLPETGGAAPGESSAPEEVDLAEIVSSLPALENSPEPPPPSQEEGLLPRNADEQAIAAVLKTAAAQGTPFCEECARVAKRTRGAVNA